MPPVCKSAHYAPISNTQTALWFSHTQPATLFFTQTALHAPLFITKIAPYVLFLTQYVHRLQHFGSSIELLKNGSID